MFKPNRTMTQLNIMHDLLRNMYTGDYDTVHGHMIILRHYIDDNTINIHFSFSKRKFNLVWEYHAGRERYAIWTKNKKTGDIIKKEYSFLDLLDLKFL